MSIIFFRESSPLRKKQGLNICSSVTANTKFKGVFLNSFQQGNEFQSYANARELTAHVGDIFDLLALINNFHMEGVLTKILAVEEILNFMISSHMFNFQSKHLQLF